MSKINNKTATLYALAAVLLWSTVATAFKIALQYLSVIELLLIANLTSAITLFKIALFTGRLTAIRHFKRADVVQSAFFGLLNPFVYYLVLFSAYDLLPAQQAQAINYTWAITLPLLAVPILKHKLTRFDIYGLLIAYLGVVMISSGGDLRGFSETNPKGVALALFSTLIWALYWVLNTKRQKDPIVGLMLNFFFGLFFIVVYYLLFAEIKPISSKGFLAAVYVGLFEMSLTFYLWLTALRLTDSTARISTLIFLSPFLSLVLIHFLLGEDIKVTTILGLIVILVGVYIQKRSTKKQAQD